MTSQWTEVDAIKITFKHTALVIYAFLDIYGAVTRIDLEKLKSIRTGNKSVITSLDNSHGCLCFFTGMGGAFDSYPGHNRRVVEGTGPVVVLRAHLLLRGHHATDARGG